MQSNRYFAGRQSFQARDMAWHMADDWDIMYVAQDICRVCVLPKDFPSADFVNGVCQYCRLQARTDETDWNQKRETAETLVSQAIQSVKSYQFIVALSGGKDSSYALIYLRKTFGSKILAVTLDNGFLSSQAKENCIQLCASLGVQHLIVKPPEKQMSEILTASTKADLHSKASMLRASSICNSCIRVVDTQIINLACQHEIPVIVWGYISGQTAVSDGFLWHDLKASVPFRRAFADRLRKELSHGGEQWLEPSIGSVESVAFFHPLIFLRQSESQIDSELKAHGWILPKDTGLFSTNCVLNDLGIQVHRDRFGFHPYVLKISKKVRMGRLSRAQALKMLSAQPDQTKLAEIHSVLFCESSIANFEK